MSKVSVIGAGNVGATCANAMLHMKFVSEIVLLDIKEGKTGTSPQTGVKSVRWTLFRSWESP